MVAAAFLPVLIPLLALGTGLASFLLSGRTARWLRPLNLGAAVVQVLLAVVVAIGVSRGAEYEWRASLLPDIDLVLRVDPIPLLFLVLSSSLWLVTTVYALGYLDEDERRPRFFGFFGFCVAATLGVALAGNLITFLIAYELLTMATYPLVVHSGSREARKAGRAYLAATLLGGTALLAGVVGLYWLVGSVEFGDLAAVASTAERHPGAITAIFLLLVGGLGVKAVVVPLHAWLPKAMVAPTPVSALLHAVAVVKAGVYGIVRVVHDLFGQQLAFDLGVLRPLALLAAVTVVYGSVLALLQTDLKRRLAYSTISQLSFITLGTSIVGFTTTVAGLVHLVHQGVMKVTLFYCAGNLARALDISRVDELAGVGRRLPGTMVPFSVAAVGMVGLPPTAGFITKWYLGTGAADAGEWWVLGVLAASTLLNAAYFLPLVVRAWARDPAEPVPVPRSAGSHRFRTAGGWLEGPPMVTAASVVLLGVAPLVPGSPLSWATVIAEELMAR